MHAEGEALWWSEFNIQTDGQIIVHQMKQFFLMIWNLRMEVFILLQKKYIYQMSLAGVFEKIKETNISEWGNKIWISND